MKITHLLKVTLLGLMLSLLAGCQSAPKGLTAEQIVVLKEQGFYLTDEGWTLDLANRVLFANNVGAGWMATPTIPARAATTSSSL